MFKTALILLFLATPASAKCKDQNVHHPRPLPRQTVAQPCTTSSWQKLKDGFAVTAGFRWDRDCPEFRTVLVRPGTSDPFFIGAELRVPLTDELTLAGNFDRDWTDAPDWNARVHLSYHVFK